jgi:hypothetical protein
MAASIPVRMGNPRSERAIHGKNPAKTDAGDKEVTPVLPPMGNPQARNRQTSESAINEKAGGSCSPGLFPVPIW